MLAIDIQEDPAKVEAWVKAKGITPPVLLDRGAVAAAYRVGDAHRRAHRPHGRMLARATGTRPWDSRPGRALLDAALAAP